jgi:SHS2 domain-containing protein
MPDQDMPIAGVSGLEHTADVGLEIVATDLPQLFTRAALGAMWLALERDGEGEGPEIRSVALSEPDLPALLRSWLRTLLYWQETDGFVVAEARVVLVPEPSGSAPDGRALGLRAQVEGCIDEGPPVREIKGVTYHGLVLERRGVEWFGRVIFDV